MSRWLGFLEDILISPTRHVMHEVGASGREPQAAIAEHMLTHVIDLMFPVIVQRAGYFKICLLIILLCVTPTTGFP